MSRETSVKMWQPGQEIRLIRPMCEKWDPKRSLAYFPLYILRFPLYFLRFLIEFVVDLNEVRISKKISPCLFKHQSTHPQSSAILTKKSNFHTPLMSVVLTMVSTTACTKRGAGHNAPDPPLHTRWSSATSHNYHIIKCLWSRSQLLYSRLSFPSRTCGQCHC